jgi:hypothetical protein
MWKGLVLLGFFRAILSLLVKAATWVHHVAHLRREQHMAMAAGI